MNSLVEFVRRNGKYPLEIDGKCRQSETGKVCRRRNDWEAMVAFVLVPLNGLPDVATFDLRAQGIHCMDLTEQEALEYLATLSVLARWVDKSTVEK